VVGFEVLSILVYAAEFPAVARVVLVLTKDPKRLDQLIFRDNSTSNHDVHVAFRDFDGKALSGVCPRF
jgi:hypothetical protein